MKLEYNAIDIKSLLDQKKWSEARSFWLHCYDESLAEFVRREIKEIDSGQKCDEILLVKGSDLSMSWIENNLSTLTLFADNRPIIITNALSAKKDILKSLFMTIATSSKKISLYSFGKLEPSLVKEYTQYDDFTFLQVKAPAFWDFDKLILSLFQLKKFNITSRVAHFLGSRIGQDIHEILNAMSICSLNFPDGNLKLNEVEEIFKSSRHIDRFKLAKYFNQKKLSLFFQELLDCDVAHEEFRSFFSFMNGHCTKIIDPSYAQAKKKMSGYDRDIVQASKQWNTKQLDFMIEKFSTWTISCKKREDIKEEIRAIFVLFNKKSMAKSTR